jgi:hypothetical protein
MQKKTKVTRGLVGWWLAALVGVDECLKGLREVELVVWLITYWMHT